MEEMIFLNGKLLPLKEARVSVLSPAFLYGWGLFETMRSLDGRIVYFNRHMARIKDSCKCVKIAFPYPAPLLKDRIEQLVKINGFKDSFVRLTISKSQGKKSDTFIFSRRYLPLPSAKYKKGFSCLVSESRANENCFLARHKTANYLLYRLSYLEAKEKGFDEAIILNSRGYLAEGAKSNIFFVKDRQLFSPSLECGCLAGITRGVVFDLAKKNGIKAFEGKFTLSDILGADEAFLTNSLMCLMPLTRIGKRNVGKARALITSLLMEDYSGLLTNGT